MEIFFKFTSDVFDKDLRIFKVFLEKKIEIRLHNKRNVFMVAFLLGPSRADGIIEKKDYQYYIIHLIMPHF